MYLSGVWVETVMTPKLRNLRCVLVACPVKERTGHSSLPMLLRTLAIRTTHSRVLPATMRHAKVAQLITITSGHLSRKVSARYPTDVSRGAHLCTKSGGQNSAHKESAQEATEDKEDKKQSEDHPKDEEQEPPLEPISWARMMAYLLGSGVALGCLYMIGKELLPSRMSANHLFNEAFDVVKADHEIRNRFGEGLKGFGRDGGGRKEGRRNFIDHKEYIAEDGTKRLRIRFNIEGPHGNAAVFAEVTDSMKQGEWVYLLVQDLQFGKVYTVADNRAMLAAMAKSQSEGERAALQALYKGGGER